MKKNIFELLYLELYNKSNKYIFSYICNNMPPNIFTYNNNEFDTEYNSEFVNACKTYMNICLQRLNECFNGYYNEYCNLGKYYEDIEHMRVKKELEQFFIRNEKEQIFIKNIHYENKKNNKYNKYKHNHKTNYKIQKKKYFFKHCYYK